MIDRPLIYVAGPYRKPDPVKNTNRAIRTGHQLRALGADVRIPHLSLLEDMVAPLDDQEWLAITLRDCERCDAIFRLDGYSEGTEIEVATMLGMGRKLLLTMAESADWIRQWKERHERGLGTVV